MRRLLPHSGLRRWIAQRIVQIYFAAPFMAPPNGCGYRFRRVQSKMFCSTLEMRQVVLPAEFEGEIFSYRAQKTQPPWKYRKKTKYRSGFVWGRTIK